MGKLEAIWIKRVRRGKMDPAESASLVKDQGIVGNANQGGRRQVTIIEKEVWQDVMHDLDADKDPGTRRANLMIGGVPLKESRGRVLRIGSVRIEIMGETKPCERMEEALPGLRSALYPDWHGGAYGIVLEDGNISVGDPVTFE
jgi:MOSC domain-containing protein YiiM